MSLKDCWNDWCTHCVHKPCVHCFFARIRYAIGQWWLWERPDWMRRGK